MNRWVNIFHWFHLCGHDSENQQFIRFGQHKVSCFLFWFQQDVYRWVNIYECECDVVSNWSLSNLLVGDDACAVFGLVKHWEVLKLDSIHPPCLEVLLDLLSELPVKEDMAIWYYSSIFCKWWDFGGMSSFYTEIGGIHPTGDRPEPRLTTLRNFLIIMIFLYQSQNSFLHLESKS